MLLCAAILWCGLAWCVTGAGAAEKSAAPSVGPSATARLSLDEALALFLRQNLDLIIAKYGIDYAQGQAITARLVVGEVE
mgnify:CR=1 FL=1